MFYIYLFWRNLNQNVMIVHKTDRFKYFYRRLTTQTEVNIYYVCLSNDTK